MSFLFSFGDHDFFNFIACPDKINHFKSFVYFSEAGVLTIEVACIISAMANEKLGTSGISSGMSH